MNAPRFRNLILALAGFGAIYHTAPWPILQGLLHTFLVLGLAPAFGTSLGAVLVACAAGWVVEGTLHQYPRLGGTALADMTLALLAHWMRTQWPPEGVRSYAARLAVLCVALALLTHLVVRLAAGPHAWGTGWLWALLLVPAWGWWAFRLLPPPSRR